jgi:hypothetical protein
MDPTVNQDQKRIHVIAFLKEAEEATDIRTSGLMDRRDFVMVIRRLVSLTQELLGECGQLEHQRDALLRRLTSMLPKTVGIPLPTDVQDQLQLTPMDVARLDQDDERFRDATARMAAKAQPADSALFDA